MPADPVYRVIVAGDALDVWTLVINAVIGVATVITLIWTVRTTRHETRVSAEERRTQATERARQRRDQEREQASHIVAWSQQVSVVQEEVDDEGVPHVYEVGRPGRYGCTTPRPRLSTTFACGTAGRAGV